MKYFSIFFIIYLFLKSFNYAIFELNEKRNIPGRNVSYLTFFNKFSFSFNIIVYNILIFKFIYYLSVVSAVSILYNSTLNLFVFSFKSAICSNTKSMFSNSSYVI